MPPTTAPPRPMMAVPNRKLSDVVLALLLAVPLLAVALVLAREPSHVSSVTIRNPAEYRLNVGLADEHGARALPLGAVDRGTYLTVDDVLEQGDTWVFTFSYGGVRATELRLSRDDLAATDWTVVVPDNAGGALEAAGLEPSPPPSADDPQHL